MTHRFPPSPEKSPNPAYEFGLENLPEVSVYAFPYRITLKLKGRLTLQKKGTLADFTISNLQKIEVEARSEAASALQDLASRVKVSFDPDKMSLDLSCALISTLKTPYGKLTHKLEIGFRSIKFVCETTSVAGEHQGILIQGTMGYEVEIEGDNLPLTRQPAFQPGLYHQPMAILVLPRVEADLWPVVVVGTAMLLVAAAITTSGTIALPATISFAAVYFGIKE
jgi:hypothetical protein